MRGNSQYLVFNRDQTFINGAVIEKEDHQKPTVCKHCQDGEEGLKISQGAEDEYCNPVENYQLLRVELDREIRMPAYYYHAADVPSVEGGEGVESQQWETDLRYVVLGE